ncbi:amino acid/amide ABC transporter membrane protein 1, HAAT family [Halobiforma haloterrestris]|uniref:Amino acid/amide ABC transporter membrane protein 1, HAAT family n=1 Tax=Natronobacterium haloterrestre TaxID=148448 RepID=A0A1I1DC60_NATHA|nr:branched-chain amino acid ABC transporter permease [Halobiforma haloterrestris]SFB71942.1 amino acid/amide ABC transporter membrane protein 1, HAAT family [Halobiforma haloterrestris]
MLGALPAADAALPAIVDGALARHALNGVYYGFILFMIASGLTIIFGVLGVLNLAHGELYALGAFSVFSVVGFLTGLIAEPTNTVTAVVFGIVVLAGSLAAAAVLLPVGAAIEAVFVRPIDDRDEVYQLLLTYGLLLVLVDVMKFVWGPAPLEAGVFRELNAIPTTELVGISYPSYNVIVILVGLAVFGWLVWFFDRTKTGRIVRATAINREMSTAIGVSTDRTFTLVFAMGAFFAGFGGAMVSIGPSTAYLEMGLDPLVLSFVVIVIGGLGSLKGALVGALLVGVTSRVVTPYYPQLELAAPFILMVLVLLVRPEGLYGTWGEIE